MVLLSVWGPTREPTAGTSLFEILMGQNKPQKNIVFKGDKASVSLPGA